MLAAMMCVRHGYAQPRSAPIIVQIAGDPQQMVSAALDRARQSGPSSIAWLSVALRLRDRVAVDQLAARLAAFDAVGADAIAVRDQARWIAASMAPRSRPDLPPGLLRTWEVAGPFDAQSGGLAAREGPENGAGTWDRGALQVRPRIVPPGAVGARGVPLDLMIHPRVESCTYLGSQVDLTQPRVFTVWMASSGSLRAAWDGRDVVTQAEVHEGAWFDRAAIRVEAVAGRHSLLVKVCSGASPDDGFVRVRVTDDAGDPVDLPWTAGLSLSQVARGGQATRRPTLLSRLLGDPAPSPSRALEMALARSFAGADDLKKPQVPGLLDVVLRQPGASPPSIALAGWATPFVGEGSARLQTAWSRASAAHDVSTMSFVARRLAELRMSSGFGRWASDAVTGAPVGGEDDTEARLLRAQTAAMSSVARSVQTRAMLDIARQAPSVPAVWQAVAASSHAVDRSVWAFAQDKLWQTSSRADCADHVRAMLIRSPGDAAAAGVACATGAPERASEVVEVAQVLLDAGRYADARHILRVAEPWLPNVAEYWATAASAWQASAPGLPADPARALRALRRAAELRPTDAAIASRLGVVDGKQNSAKVQGLADASVFLARKQAEPARPGSHAERLLHWFRKVEVLGDGRVSQTLHYAREIVLVPRTPHDLEEDLPMRDAGLEIVRARVHRQHGGVADAQEQESDGDRSRIRWPDLRPGDVVEVVLHTVTDGPVGRTGDPPFFFVDYIGGSETAPLLYGEVIVDAPIDRPLALDVLHGVPDRLEDRIQNGRRVQRFCWDRPRTVADESFSPDPTELVPTVLGSTFASWKDFVAWYGAAVQGFTDPDDQIRALAYELTAGAKTREQKVARLFQFVADEIRYVNYVSAEAWLPNRPQQVLARRQGDCDDKAILLIALLRAVGIEATEVLLQSRYTAQPSVLLSSRVAIPLFDHGIAYLPGPAGAPGTWLDPTNPQSRVGPVPALDARALALFVQPGAERPVATPASSPADHGVDAVWTVRLDADGGGVVKAREEHVGDDGQEARRALAEPDTRAGWVEQHLLAGWLGAARVRGPVQFMPDAGHGLARVQFEAEAKRVARREGSDLVVQLAPDVSMSGKFASMPVRTLPLVLPPEVAPRHGVWRIRIEPPGGFVPDELAPGGRADGGPFGRAELAIERVENGVMVVRSVVLDQSVIPVESYGPWRAWLQRVDALMQRAVRFVRADRLK